MGEDSLSPKRTKKTAKKPPKTHVAYWRDRLHQNSTGQWEVRLWQGSAQSRRFRFDGTKEEAAAAARDRWLQTKVGGFAKAEVTSKTHGTWSGWLTAVETSNALGAATFRTYKRKLRTLLRELQIRESDRIRDLQAERVQQWFERRRSRGKTGEERREAYNTAVSTLRNAASLFSRRIRRVVGVQMENTPFDGVEIPSARHIRHASLVAFDELLKAARGELEADVLAAFLLAAGSGLRRGESDRLKWEHIDFKARTLRTSGKTDASQAEVEVPESVVVWLQRNRHLLGASYVIPAKLESVKGDYRANAVFNRLVVWLRSHGLEVMCPYHYLRKEFGSMVNSKYGLHAASVALRHGGIGVTSQHYVARPARIEIDLGEI